MFVKISSAVLKIVSLNVRGITEELKKKDAKFSHGVAERMQTIFLLQEMHLNKATENQWQRGICNTD